MTSPAPYGALLNRTPAPSESPTEDFHPDVVEYAAARGITRRRDMRYLQGQYDRGLLAREARESESPVLMRTVRRRGSFPVDAQVGERATSRIQRRRETWR